MEYNEISSIKTVTLYCCRGRTEMSRSLADEYAEWCRSVGLQGLIDTRREGAGLPAGGERRWDFVWYDSETGTRTVRFFWFVANKENRQGAHQVSSTRKSKVSVLSVVDDKRWGHRALHWFCPLGEIVSHSKSGSLRDFSSSQVSVGGHQRH